MQRHGALGGDPDAVVDLYTRQSCLRVTARDLALMGATLADGGVHPVTREQVVAPLTCRYTLAVMATAGLSESLGLNLFMSEPHPVPPPAAPVR